jgi:hypothetical protein
MARYRAAARSSVAGLADDLQADAAGGAPKGLSYVTYLRGDLETKRPAGGFPSAEMVRASAALHSPNSRRRSLNGPRYEVIVTPGVVRFKARGLSGAGPPPGVRRAEITAWTPQSRTRMLEGFSSVDTGPLLARGPAVMVTLTLPGEWQVVAPTGAEFKRLFRRWLDVYRRTWGEALACFWVLEFQRRGAPHIHMVVPAAHGKPRALVDADVSEKAAHTRKSGVFGPGCPTGERADHGSGGGDQGARRSRESTAWCRCRVCGVAGELLTFTAWCSHSWAAVVNHPDPEQYRRHVLAGTGVDWTTGHTMTDTKRLVTYFDKHAGTAGGKEYQKEVPELWRAPGKGPGRFWGYRGMRRISAVADVTPADWDAKKRTVRRLSQRVTYTPPGARFPTRVEKRCHDVRVPRGPATVDPVTGELRQRYRKVRRPYSYMPGKQGGFVLVNDGPALMSALSRIEGVKSNAQVRVRRSTRVAVRPAGRVVDEGGRRHGGQQGPTVLGDVLRL